MICTACAEDKPLTRENFVPRKDMRSGFDSKCRKCRNLMARKGRKWPLTLADRFWSRVNKDGPIPPHRPELGNCWEWSGGTFEDGYGTIATSEGSRRTHRVAFLLEHGRWPDPQALHHCDNRLCVRVSHLFEGTPADNVHDCWSKGRGRHGDNSGERCGKAKLRQCDVHVIRAAALPPRDLAKMFNVSDEAIYEILRGNSWSNFPGAIV